ncbi:hypothetical protein KIH39_03630 [Telmatocola sphagniphila]|uniref:Sialate O-acetylesterase domain-containing protein n=1 Tax=Telmatocola sphagniphila TaxID=1123043 RepID=A0A8E6ETY6_9BACT|nr:sialate O-acetylesterase [Telmatocola sphagniphila]QVL33019.1 hypothetical protein KIH39_03630 [Telmatocola sphagniphila]
MRWRGLYALAILTFSGLAYARAEVKPHALFTDHMVLQQGKKIPVWGTATGDAKITVSINGKDYSTTAAKGSWKVEIDPVPVGGPYELKITSTEDGKTTTQTLKDVLVGEVWVCSGQSNMEMSLGSCHEADKSIQDSTNDKIRLFTVTKNTSETPLKTFKGGPTEDHTWVECNPKNTPRFSGVAYYFGSKLQKELGVPVGLIHTSWGGTPAEAWTSKESLDAVPALKHYHENLDKRIAAFDPEKAEEDYKKAMEKYEADLAKVKAENEGKEKKDQKPEPRKPNKRQKPGQGPNDPSRLYNAMIHPLLPFPVAGAIWYQGESNAGRAYEYRTLMPTLISDWRKAWNSDLPFFMVQLAPFTKIVSKPGPSNWAELREAQLLTTKALPKVGIAVITDVGDEVDIHPKKKQPVGERLAISALNIAYGKSVEPIGPEYKSFKIEGSKIVLSFDHLGGGLECKEDKLMGFSICGDDHKFVDADAKIEGDHVVVWSDTVSKPVAVRYGWANYPVVNLWGKSGLPATPFRTDEFPETTWPKK